MNFPPSTGYPFGSKSPLPHEASNEHSERIQATINATDGSAHAPTADIELSGSMGGGLKFDTVDPVPFYGTLDVSGSLLCTAPSAGSVIFDKLVSVDVRGVLTFKASPAGSPGSCSFEAGTSCTFNGASTLTLGSSSTCNLSGATAVRGTLTVMSTANSGPGHIILQTDSDLTLNTGAIQYVFGEARILNGADLKVFSGGTVTLASGSVANSSGTHNYLSGTKPALDPARTWYRRARLLAATIDTGVPQGFGTPSPLYSAPTIYSLGGSSDPVELYLEFDPPHAGIITAVAIRSVVAMNPVGAITRATYELLRWDNGLDANGASLSTTATDGHAADGTDWDNVLTTSLSGISGSAVDRSHGYGLRITAGRVGGAALAMYYDVKITGTIDELNGC